MLRSIRTTAALLLLVALGGWAGMANAAFEELAISPRARAMGSTVIAVPGDAWAFNHNPALLAILDQPYASTSTVQPNGVDFNRLTALGGALPLPGARGGVAFGYRYYSVDMNDVTLTREQTISFAHGITLFQDASSSAQIGWGLNFYNLEFGETVGGIDPGSAWTWGLDAGVLVTLHERTRAGFFTRNLNNPTIGEENEELRQMVGGGISYVPYPGVTTAFDLKGQLGEQLQFHGGAEFAITRYLDLRLGIATEPNKLSAGFGVNLPKRFALDYGFSTGGGVLDSSHQFGLTVRFGPEGGE